MGATAAADGVVDVCSFWLDGQGAGAYFEGLFHRAPAYAHAFARSLGRSLGVPAETLTRTGSGGTAALIDLVASRTGSYDAQGHLARLDEEGVAIEIVHGSPWVCGDGSTVNDRLHDACRATRGRVRPWTGVDLLDPAEALRTVREGVGNGTQGFGVSPFLADRSPVDDDLRPVLDAIADTGLPLWVHCGHHLRAEVPLDLCTWREVDRLAGRYPRTTIVVGHAGWPWVPETLAVALRHPRVYLEISSHPPRRWSAPGSGFAALLPPQQMTRSRVLFGSGGTWVRDAPVPDLVDQLRATGMAEDVLVAWLRTNASRALDLVP